MLGLSGAKIGRLFGDAATLARRLRAALDMTTGHSSG